MQKPTPNAYLRTQVMTAGPMQLRLLLFEGGLKFCRQGREGLAREDFEKSYENLSRARNIVLELANSLNHRESPELCERLAALYNFMYRRLIEASMQRDATVVDEVIELLDYQRETWRQLMEQASPPQQPEPQRAESGSQPPRAATPAAAYPAGMPPGSMSTLSQSA